LSRSHTAPHTQSVGSVASVVQALCSQARPASHSRVLSQDEPTCCSTRTTNAPAIAMIAGALVARGREVPTTAEAYGAPIALIAACPMT